MIEVATDYQEANTASSKVPISQVTIIERGAAVVTVTEPTLHWDWLLSEAGGTRHATGGSANLFPSNSPEAIADGQIHFTAADWDGLFAYSQTAIQSGPDWSLHIRVKLDTRPSSGNDYIICQKWGSGVAGDREYKLRLNNTGGTYRIKFDFASNSGSTTTTVTASTFGTPSTGVWYDIVLRHDVSLVTIKISVNDQQDTTTYTSTANTGSAVLNFGGSGGTSQFDGYMMSPDIWHGVEISDAMVTALYNAGGDPIDYDNYTTPTTTTLAIWADTHPIDGTDTGERIMRPVSLDRLVDIEECRLPGSTLVFELFDLSEMASAIIADDIKGCICEFRQSFRDLDWDDNAVRTFTGIVTEMAYNAGRWTVTAKSRIAAAQDKTIFGGASTTLATTINDTDTTVVLTDGSSFESSADFPESARKLIAIDGEIIKHRSKSSNTFSDCIRSTYPGLPVVTAPAAHTAGAAVHELIKHGELNTDTDLDGDVQSDEMHPVEMIKFILTHSGQSGISEAEIEYDEDSFDEVKEALGADLQVFYVFTQPVSAKKLIESICNEWAMFLIEDGDGVLKLKLYDATPTDARELTDADLVSVPQFVRNAKATFNVVVYHFNYAPTLDGDDEQKYLGTYTYRDEDLITQMGREVVYHIWSKGIRSEYTTGGRWFSATAAAMADRAAAMVDRFGSAAPIISAGALLAHHLLEPGDDVSASFSHAIDLSTGTLSITNQSMQVSKLHTDFRKTTIELLSYPL